MFLRHYEKQSATRRHRGATRGQRREALREKRGVASRERRPFTVKHPIQINAQGGTEKPICNIEALSV